MLRTIIKRTISKTKITPPHHDGSKFQNPWPSYSDRTPFEFLTKVLPNLKRTPSNAIPLKTPQWDLLRSPSGILQATWLGHACVLFQAGGFNFLTDPMFSRRASPMQCIGPTRYTPAPCTVEDLPPIHFVLISHNHYDHLDETTLQSIIEKEKRDLSGTRFVCPVATKATLVACGVPSEKVIELDWWDEYLPQLEGDSQLVPARYFHSPLAGQPEVQLCPPASPSSSPHSSIRIVCVPAQHHSARTAFDRFCALWCGFTVVVPSSTPAAASCSFYFSGDTGYRSVPETPAGRNHPWTLAEEKAFPACPAFAQMRDRFGPVDLAALPIGAYSPRWFMSSVHASPEDAVDMFRDLGARKALAIHWGTLPLTDEPLWEPVTRLHAALETEGISRDTFRALSPGETIQACD